MKQDPTPKSFLFQGTQKPVETILDQWRKQRPDLDPLPMAVCGEIWRAGDRLMHGVQTNLKAHNLDFSGFDVLMALRRNGVSNALSPSTLANDMRLSTSAMTNRLDRLETRGLIRRVSDPADRRAIHVYLTKEGAQLADEVVETHLQTEEHMLARLSEDERLVVRALMSKIAQQE